MVAGGPVSAAL